MPLTRDRALVAGALIAGAVITWLGARTATAFLPYLLGAAGLVAVQERLRFSFERDIATLTTLVIFAGSSLFWSMTHGSGVADTLAFALVAIGMLVLSRTDRNRRLQLAGWIAIGAIPFAVRFTFKSPTHSSTTDWTAPLFSSSGGLLSMTPVAYVALVGLGLSLKQTAMTGACALAVLAAWIVGSALFPSAGVDGRLAHGLTSALALLAPGLAFAIDRARQRPWVAVGTLAVAAVLWNYWLMVQYTIGTVPKDGPVSFAAMVRQQADVHTQSPYVYPFAVPANLWFAWREGLPVDRYETLAFEPRRETLDLTLDRDASRFLLDGWEATSADAVEAHAWTRERRATIVVPLALPPGPVDMIVTSRARLEEPAVAATLGVEVNGREIGRLVAQPAAPADASFRIPADVGPVWRAGYNRVTFVSYSVARVDPNDQRPAGPLARRIGDRAWPVAIYRLRIATAQAP